IIVTTSSARISQQLAIVHGTKTFIRPDDKLQATKLTNWLLEKGTLSKGDIIVTASGRKPGVVGSTDTIKVRVME
ncbi:pyruvate kinase, partial [Candidatus Saccharibacteria bacterium]|nr:pyruvate kinase [Candidatus Saccharibacteria bacterium]